MGHGSANGHDKEVLTVTKAKDKSSVASWTRQTSQSLHHHHLAERLLVVSTIHVYIPARTDLLVPKIPFFAA